MMATVRRRVVAVDRMRAVRGQPLPMVGNSLGLIVGKVASMALGFLFWLVAAHVAAPGEVGLAAGSVAAMMLCTQLALLGVGSAFILRLPLHRGAPVPLLDTAISLAALSSAAASILFLLAAGIFLHHLAFVATDPVYALLFLAMAVTGTLGILLDQVSIAFGRGTQVLSRNVASGVMSLVAAAALPLVSGSVSATELFATWVAGGVVTCGVGAFQLGRCVPGYRYRPRMDRSLSRDLIVVGLPNHALTLTERLPGLVLPIAVTELLSPATNAYWYVIWMMAWVIYTAPISVGMALFAEAVQQPQRRAAAVRRAIRSSLMLGSAGALVLAACAHPFLSLLGAGYADAGEWPLRVLLLALVPLSFVQAYYAAARAISRLGEALVAGVITSLVSVIVTMLAGVAAGLLGMALAWSSVQGLAGLWAATRLRRLGALDRNQAGDLDLTAPARSVAVPALTPDR